MVRKYILIFFIGLCLPVIISAQDTAAVASPDSAIVKKKKRCEVLKPYHKNVIKFNPTPMLIWGQIRNITLSYERLIAPNHSLAIQMGYLLFPRLTDDTVLNLVAISAKEKYGVNLALDYRYYPCSRNRRPAPDGLYLGAYISYYGYHFKNKMDILNTTVDQNGGIEGRLNITNLGLQLGYQFIFWKRLSLDLMLFGPSFSYYSGELNISGNLDPDQIENLNKELVEKLMARFPLLKSIFSGETLQFTGSRSNFNIGFRYSVQIGIHF